MDISYKFEYIYIYIYTIYSINYNLHKTISIIGVIGNLLVITVILNTEALRRRRVDFFIVHQSCIDLLASIIILALTQTRKNKVITI